MTTEEVRKYVVRCSACGDLGPEAFNRDVAIRKARDAGWADEKGQTLCPECRKR